MAELSQFQVEDGIYHQAADRTHTVVRLTMHEIELIEGELNVRGTDWIKADRSGARYIRPDGYAGAPTAELVGTPLGWVGTSWIMQPRRELWLPRETTLEWAVYNLEVAEGVGPDAPAWLSLRVPSPDTDGLGGLIPFSAPGRPRRWAKMMNGHSLVLIEGTGPAGAPRYQVVIDSALLTRLDGEPVLFTDLADALYNAEMEIT
jgi:hypothetical protein